MNRAIRSILKPAHSLKQCRNITSKESSPVRAEKTMEAKESRLVQINYGSK
jgi:hypothetical protein